MIARQRPCPQRMEALELQWLPDKGYGRVRFRCKRGHEHWWKADYKLGRKKIPYGKLQFEMLCKRWLNGGADGVCPECEKERVTADTTDENFVYKRKRF